jgi:hypothetical protein
VSEAAVTLIEAIHDDLAQMGVAAALLGLLYENTAAAIRGALPDGLANDDELRSIYVELLETTLRPFAHRAVESFTHCGTCFANVSDSSWGGWAEYCLGRAQEVGEGYEPVGARSADDGDESARR